VGVNEVIGALKGSALQPYCLDVPGTASAPGLDVVEFNGVEEAGVPTYCKIKLTHALADLPRADFLTKPATFSIRPPTLAGVRLPAGPGRRVQGVITELNQLSSSRDQTIYEIVLESRLALLRNVRRCRFFLNQTFPQTIEQILREHGFGAGTSDFEFTLLRDYEKRVLIAQWHETDLEFITRLARRSGMWFVMREGEYGEVVHFGDDFTHYERSAAFTAPYRPAAGLESSGAEAVESFETRMKTIAQSVSVRHYNYNAAPQKIDGEANVAPDDKTTYGTPDVWAAGHLTDDQAEWEAQLRHQALLCEQVVYIGAGNALCMAPGRVFKFTNRTLPEAEYGQFITRVEYSGSRKDAYRNTYTAIPSHLIYRLPLLEETWPKVHGTVSGRVTSPDRYKYGYVNSKGEYQVAIDPDRDPRMAGLTSCWMRLAKPFAGAMNTGFHFTLLDGTGVEIAFQNGDPDLPFIAHVMHDGVNPDLITSDDRWMTRNAIHTQSNNTVQLEDFEGEEHVKISTEGGGKSQLSLGIMVDRNRQKRGIGFELRSDSYGALRSGKGLLVTTDARTGAQGEQLSMDEAKARLEQAHSLMEDLSANALAAKAYAAECDKQRDLLQNTLIGFKKSGILVTSPQGIALAGGDHVQISASENLIASAGGNADVGALKRITMAAGEAISLFAKTLGLKFFAAKGPIEIEAQSDAVSVQADKNVEITSVGGRVIISAKEEILLVAGGSYIRLNGSGIEDGTPGDRRFKSASFGKTGPASLNMAKAWSFNRPACRQCMKEMAAAHDAVAERV